MLLNKAAVKDFIWQKMEVERPALQEKFTRISAGTYEALDVWLRNKIVQAIKQHPSSGKTFEIYLGE